jgi:hypothetical protein
MMASSLLFLTGGLDMPEFKFDIVKNFGTISENNSGWVKEVNLVSWNDREPIYDIRAWQEGHEKLGKGITLTTEELKNLKELLNTLDIE